MLFKLSIKNLRKSIKDYTIYFATLILGIAIFYVFNSMGSQTVLLTTSRSTKEIIILMNRTLSIVSVFVSFVLGFLIVYASSFMMKRRKKEFGIYLLLGMGKAKVTKVIVMETLCIGLISLVVGLGLGIVASQGMSVIVADMFEADMTRYRFLVSGEAIGKTLLYFACIYLVVLVFNTVIVGKARLITLLTAAKKQEKNTVKNPILCLCVFCVGAVLLGTAYYYVTAGAEELSKISDVVRQIIKGIVGTFLVFWSFSGLMIFAATKNKRFYFKRLRCFTIKELAGRINTTVISGSIICLMLFITICVLSSAMSVKKSINDSLKNNVPIDVEFHQDFVEDAPCEGIADVFYRTGVDTSVFKDIVEVYLYRSDPEGEKNEGLQMVGFAGEQNVKKLDYADSYVEFLRSMDIAVMRLSDYNRAAKLYGNQEYTLADDEYMIIANFDSNVKLYNMGLSEQRELMIGGRAYHPKYRECKDGYLEMTTSTSNTGMIVVPDSADLQGLVRSTSFFLANYNAPTEKEYKKIEQYIDSEEFADMINSEERQWPYVNINSKSSIYSNSIGLTAMIVFIGLYLGIIMMISGAAILALKELSEAADNKDKYQVLRQLGVEEKQVRHSLFVQSGMFFGLPLLLAGVHSIFGIQTCMMILESFGRGGLLYSIVITAMILVAVYGVYFVLTYQCCKRIIKE